MTFTPLHDVPVHYKYIVFCDVSQDALYLADDISHEKLTSLPMNSEAIADMKNDQESSVEIWTRPFDQLHYRKFLQQYAYLCTGKALEYGVEEVMLRDGWTKHQLSI